VKRSKPLQRTGFGSRARANGVAVPRRAVSSASDAQRAKVRNLFCAAAPDPLALCVGPIDPAHVIPRGVMADGQDDALAVIPLCRWHHIAYDTGGLDLLPALEAHGYRDELAFAVARVGLLATYRRVTNTRLGPEG